MVTDVTIWNDNQHTDNYRLGFEFQDENKPDEIILTNRDDDKGYNNPHRWEFKIIDKDYVDNADRLLQNQITTNQQNIQNNANAIAVNAQNIQANSTQLADHESRITQNRTDINTINNTLQHLNTHTMPIFDKVYSHKNGANYFRYHSYITDVTDTEIKVGIEIDFASLDDIFSKVELWKFMPWLSYDNVTNQPVVKDVYGKTVQLNQTPAITDIMGIVYNSTNNALSREELTTFLHVDANSTTEYPKMYLTTSKFTGKVTTHGRIFATLTFQI